MNDFTRQYANLINQYYPFDLRQLRWAHQWWFISKMLSSQFKYWNGGDIHVPFISNRSASLRVGGLVKASDIVQMKGFVGKITGQVAHTGAVRFNEADLMDRSNRITNTFLGNGIMNEFNYSCDGIMKALSLQMGSGPYLSKGLGPSTRTGAAALGWIKVSNPTAFRHMLKVVAQSDKGTTGPTGPKVFWVADIRLAEGEIRLSATKADAQRYDNSNYPDPVGVNFRTTGPSPLGADFANAKNIVFFPDTYNMSSASNVTSRQPTSVRDITLLAADGGDNEIYGIDKSRHTVLRALEFDGSATEPASHTARTRHLIRQLFVVDSKLKDLGLPHNNSVVMSLKKLAVCKDILETEATRFKQMGKIVDSKSFGWENLEICSVEDDKKLMLTGVREWDDDNIHFMDWKTWSWHSNGGVRQSRSPDGQIYYPYQSETGNYFQSDLLCFSQLVCNYPVGNAVLKNINSDDINLKLTA